MIVALLVVPGWSLKRLLSAHNIYFQWIADYEFHKVLFSREDAEGGFTTVIQEADAEKRAYLLWLTAQFRAQLERTLHILGIDVPAFM